MIQPAHQRFFGCMGYCIGRCAYNPFNNTAIKVMLFILSGLFLGLGIYGAVIAPQMWGSYVIIGMGALALLVETTLLTTRIIANDCLRRRE